MGRDEACTLARLKEHRAGRLEPALSRYGGRLVKLAGDGALVEFPSEVDALRAAIEFQQDVAKANATQTEEARILFRIGLHVGDLIVDGDNLYGDGVNVAARLEAEAAPGGIVLSGTMHEAIAGNVRAEFVDLGRLSLKNIEPPVQAYRVEWNEGRQPPASHHSLSPRGQSRKRPSIIVLPWRGRKLAGDCSPRPTAKTP
jgi:adenylate cyclase